MTTPFYDIFGLIVRRYIIINTYECNNAKSAHQINISQMTLYSPLPPNMNYFISEPSPTSAFDG